MTFPELDTSPRMPGGGRPVTRPYARPAPRSYDRQPRQHSQLHGITLAVAIVALVLSVFCTGYIGLWEYKLYKLRAAIQEIQQEFKQGYERGKR